MVKTRTTTGTIMRSRYDYPSLRLRGEALSPGPPQSPTTRSPKSPRTPRLRSRGDSQTGILRKTQTPGPWFDVRAIEKSIPEPSKEDIADGVNFVPPTAFGEYQAEGLSTIEHAKRRVAQWQI